MERNDSVSILGVDIRPLVFCVLVEYKTTHLLFVNFIELFKRVVLDWHKSILLVVCVDIEITFASSFRASNTSRFAKD